MFSPSILKLIAVGALDSIWHQQQLCRLLQLGSIIQVSTRRAKRGKFNCCVVESMHTRNYIVNIVVFMKIFMCMYV